jgi:hypothetical protein
MCGRIASGVFSFLVCITVRGQPVCGCCYNCSKCGVCLLFLCTAEITFTEISDVRSVVMPQILSDRLSPLFCSIANVTKVYLPEYSLQAAGTPSEP